MTTASRTERPVVFAGASMAAVYVLSTAADRLSLAETVGGGPAARYGLADDYARTGRSLVAEAFREDRPRWWNGAEPPPHRVDGTAVPPAGVSLGVLPLRAGGWGRGCLVAADDSGHGFDAERRTFLELYAEQVAAGLEADRDLAAAGTGPPAGPTTLERVRAGSFTLALRTGRITADPRVLALFDLDPADFDGRMESLIARTVPDDLPTLMSVVEPSQATTSGGRELAFRVQCPSGETRWLNLRWRSLVDRSGRPDRVLGVLADTAQLRPTRDEVSRAHRLSVHLARAMTLRDVTQVLVADLRDPLRAARLALAELRDGRPVFTVLDPSDPGTWPEAWRSRWYAQWPGTSSPVLPALERALRAGRATVWPADTDLEPGLAGIGPGGLAVLPLTAEGQVIGACLIGWDRPHDWGPEERSLLTATAGLVGQAMARVHAFEAEHELATTLQRSLLPRALPPLPGGVAVVRYRPATVGLEVGGDWYDVIPLSDGHVALVIGDVQGHSATAATIMGQIRTAIRAYAVEGHPPDVVIAHANRLLVGMETDLFATCTYVDLDMEEGDAWIVRAGHLPPLLRDPDGGTREVEVQGGPPLGVVEDAEFPMTMAGLPPGAVLALLTDGLVESATLPLEDGMLRVREVLDGSDPSDVARVADALLGGGERRDDDMALLLLRYDGMRVRPVRAGWAVWRLPDAVMHARRFTTRTLREWEVTEEVDAVLLIVSELVTNALVHTQGDVRLDLTLAGDRLRVAVSDSQPRTPVRPASVDWMATGGRGIFLVEAMSQAWGSVPVSGGKQVWGEVVLPPREPGAGGPAETGAPGTARAPGEAAEPAAPASDAVAPPRGPRARFPRRLRLRPRRPVDR